MSKWYLFAFNMKWRKSQMSLWNQRKWKRVFMRQKMVIDLISYAFLLLGFVKKTSSLQTLTKVSSILYDVRKNRETKLKIIDSLQYIKFNINLDFLIFRKKYQYSIFDWDLNKMNFKVWHFQSSNAIHQSQPRIQRIQYLKNSHVGKKVLLNQGLLWC